jgi:hypothetical protein
LPVGTAMRTRSGPAEACRDRLGAESALFVADGANPLSAFADSEAWAENRGHRNGPDSDLLLISRRRHQRPAHFGETPAHLVCSTRSADRHSLGPSSLPSMMCATHVWLHSARRRLPIACSSTDASCLPEPRSSAQASFALVDDPSSSRPGAGLRRGRVSGSLRSLRGPPGLRLQVRMIV